MKLELLFLGGIGLYIYDLWYELNYAKLFITYKKYYKAAAACIAAFSMYRLIRTNPEKSQDLLMRTLNLTRVIPLENLPTVKRVASGVFPSMYDFTRGDIAQPQPYHAHTPHTDPYPYQYPQQQQHPTQPPIGPRRMTQIHQQGQRMHSRAVGETKKKFVASQQNWKCGRCKEMLTHTFEVDHNIRLDRGGTNDVSNLVALCRECHGIKTADERMRRPM